MPDTDAMISRVREYIEESRRPHKSSCVGLGVMLLACAAVLLGQAACGGDRTASPTPDEVAVQQVREYFAGAGARYVEGLTVQDVRVIDEPRGRTLFLRFVSSDSGQSYDPFLSLYFMSTSDDGWPADLNRAGLRLAWVRMEFDYQDGSSSETLEVDIAGHGVAGSTRIRPGPPTTGP